MRYTDPNSKMSMANNYNKSQPVTASMPPPTANPIVGPSTDSSPLRNVNPDMRNMQPQGNTIASMPNTNTPQRIF